MTLPHMTHRTSTLEKEFTASLARVFEVWSDTDLRSKWNSPSDEVEIRMEEADFSENGRDVSLCIVEGQVAAHVTAIYHEIVPEKRILFTEAIRSEDVLMGASLVSVGFEARGSGTLMTITLQTVAVDGSPLLDEVVYGWTHSLERMERLFT